MIGPGRRRDADHKDGRYWDRTCREADKQAIEGREYVVRDGDVMHFRFNV